MGMTEVLRALDEEMFISHSGADQIALSKSEFEYVLIARLGYIDERTHSRYWTAMKKARLTVATNQHTAVLDVGQFRMMLGLRRMPEPKMSAEVIV